ncbi:MAG: hypothetical protein WDZ91_01825 [Paenibacillaceae bacterium]
MRMQTTTETSPKVRAIITGATGMVGVGLKEEEYHRLTYDPTLHVAETLVRLNPEMVFCYVSGSGTDSTERGRSMWARVKGKTENHLMQLPFK